MFFFILKKSPSADLSNSKLFNHPVYDFLRIKTCKKYQIYKKKKQPYNVMQSAIYINKKGCVIQGVVPCL